MGHNLYEHLLESGLSRHVDKPTRGDKILELVFSTNDSLALVSNVNRGPEISTSDHRAVSFDTNFEVYKENVSEKLIFIYGKGSFEKLRKS